MKKYVAEFLITENKWHITYVGLYTKKEIKQILDEHKNSYKKYHLVTVYEAVKEIDVDEFLKEEK